MFASARFVLGSSALGLVVLGALFSACSSSDGGGSSPGGKSGAGGSGGSDASTGGSAGSGGSVATGGQSGAGGATGGAGGTGGVSAGASVLQHHNHASRDGVYSDASFTKAALATLHRDPAFNATYSGHVYTQPLFVEQGSGGKDALYVATENNDIIALDAQTGAVLWQKNVAAPAPLSSLPCGNINPLGITGTPVIDLASKTIYFDAMTSGVKHMIYALSIEDGSAVSGWPVDVDATVSAAGKSFDSSVQNERGALVIANGVLYVPYGGHYGDCGNYNGWVVGVPLASPSTPSAYRTEADAAGSWAPSGVAADGDHVYIATGNSMGAGTWSGGEAILRLGAGPTFSGQPADYFAPSNWKNLDNGDVDIGGTGPVLFDLPGATPSKLTMALGKNGVAYLLNRENLGGVGTGNGTTGEGLFSQHVAGGVIINAAAAYTTAAGTYVAFHGTGSACPSGQSGDLVSLKMAAGSPPSFATAWCADQNGMGSPMVTTTDGSANAVVWSLGSEGDQKLHGFDADTGAVVFDGGGSGDTMSKLRRYITPIAAKGRIYVAGDDAAYAFTP